MRRRLTNIAMNMTSATSANMPAIAPPMKIPVMLVLAAVVEAASKAKSRTRNEKVHVAVLPLGSDAKKLAL
jgi:hypothetical protein